MAPMSHPDPQIEALRRMMDLCRLLCVLPTRRSHEISWAYRYLCISGCMLGIFQACQNGRSQVPFTVVAIWTWCGM